MKRVFGSRSPPIKGDNLKEPYKKAATENYVAKGGDPEKRESSTRRRQRREKDAIPHPLKVSLEDVYNGTSKKLSLSLPVICSKCKGKCSGAPMICPECLGSRVKSTIVYVGVMKYRKQYACDECKGTGQTIKYDRDSCERCEGEKVTREKRVLEVNVEKGMRDGQEITFPGEAVEESETITGDTVVILQQMEHPMFKRKGDDLFYEHTLSLTEALYGFQFVLTHLDGRRLLIKSQPGQVIKPDSIKAINDEGMPIYQKPFMKGKLYIHFTVEFPDSLAKALEVGLPPKSAPQFTDMVLDECKETSLHDVNTDEMEMLMKEAPAQQEAYGEDEDTHGGLPRVECAQQ